MELVLEPSVSPSAPAVADALLSISCALVNCQLYDCEQQPSPAPLLCQNIKATRAAFFLTAASSRHVPLLRRTQRVPHDAG